MSSYSAIMYICGLQSNSQCPHWNNVGRDGKPCAIYYDNDLSTSKVIWIPQRPGYGNVWCLGWCTDSTLDSPVVLECMVTNIDISTITVGSHNCCNQRRKGVVPRGMLPPPRKPVPPWCPHLKIQYSWFLLLCANDHRLLGSSSNSQIRQVTTRIVDSRRMNSHL